jgi:hypothetical protein
MANLLHGVSSGRRSVTIDVLVVGAFATKSCTKEPISFATSICPYATTREPLNWFSLNFIKGSSVTFVDTLQFRVKSKTMRVLYTTNYMRFCLLLERNSLITEWAPKNWHAMRTFPNLFIDYVCKMFCEYLCFWFQVLTANRKFPKRIHNTKLLISDIFCKKTL